MFAIDLGNGLTAAVEVRTGIAVETADDGDEDTAYDTTARFWNDDAGQTFRPRLTLGYSADWGGAKLRLEAPGYTQSAASPFYARYAYGWANFLDKKIVFTGGNLGGIDHLWGTAKLSGYVIDSQFDALKGVRVEFKLVDGLSFGFGLPVGDKLTIDHVGGSWVLGGLYKSSLFSVVASAQFFPGTDETAAKEGTGKTYEWEWDVSADPESDTIGDTDKGAWVPSGATAAVAANDPYVGAIFGIEVNPFAGFTALAHAQIDTRKYETHGKIGYVRIAPKFIYATGPLTAHLQGDIRIQNEAPGEDKYVNGRDGKKTYTPKVGDYADITTATVAGYTGAIAKYQGDPTVAFRVGADYKVSDTIGAYFQVGSDNVLWFAGDEEYNPLGAGLYLKPGVKITFGASSIEIFDKINRLGAKTIEAGDEDISPVTNQFQVDFNWSF
jgi:hypothetical protein